MPATPEPAPPEPATPVPPPAAVPTWPPPGGAFPPPGYPYPGPGHYPGYLSPAPPNPPRNGVGLAALLVALAGVVTALSVVGGIALGLAAVVLGAVGAVRAHRGEADNGAVAIAGIALGAVAVIAGIACIFVYIGIWRTAGGDDYMACMTHAGTDTAAQQQCTEQVRKNVENSFGLPATPAVHGR